MHARDHVLRMLRFFVLLMLSSGCAHSAASRRDDTAPPVAATTPPAETSASLDSATERPPVWYLPPGRYQAHGARVTDGERTVRLWGDWLVDVRADGTRYHVELAIGGAARTWTLVSRLELHVCANDTLQLAPDVSVAAGTRLYLRGVRPDDVTVSTSPAMPAPTYNVPLDAVTVDGCTSQPFTPEAVETEARDDRGLVVPAGTPIVSTAPNREPFEPLAYWAFEAGPERWWLAHRTASTTETTDATTEAATSEATPDAPSADPREGTLPKSAIRASIREAVPRVRACYESRLAMLPDLEGRLEVRFIILPSGEVGPVATESPGSLDLALEVCVARVVRSLRFPPPNGGGIVIVTYPFVLQLPPARVAEDG